MRHAYTWGAILLIVVASVTGDVLMSRAMKQVGDVDELRKRSGLFAVIGRVLRNSHISARHRSHGCGVL